MFNNIARPKQGMLDTEGLGEILTEVWLAFIVGLLGSLHCLGMCGGIVAALSITNRLGAPRSRVLSQVFYNLGRIFTYTMLGAAAGMAGSLFNVFVPPYEFWFYCAINTLVITIGLLSVFGLKWFSFYPMESDVGRLLIRPLHRAISGQFAFSAFPLGFLLGFLPCGLLYMLLLVAAGSGSVLRGALIMTAFGFGTMPVLFIFAKDSTSVSSKMRSILFRCVGVAVMLMGGVGLWRTFVKIGLLPGFPLL